MGSGEELVLKRTPVVSLAQLPGDLEDDDALWVDEYRARRSIDLVRVCQVCSLVEDARIRHLEFVAIDAGLILAVPDVHPDHLEPAALIVTGDAVKLGLLSPAGTAPRCPEVEEQRMAAEVFQRDAVCVEVGPNPVGGLVPHQCLALIGLRQRLLQAAGPDQDHAQTKRRNPHAPTAPTPRPPPL